MNSQRYTPKFKNETVRQIIERGNSITEVSGRLGVSIHAGNLSRLLVILI